MRSFTVSARLLSIVAAVATLLGGAFPSSPWTTPTARAQGATFVTRSGANLVLIGQPFRLAGSNIYWLGLDENVGGIDYPTQFRIDDALATAAEMGATVVRTFGAMSAGCPKCIQPTLGQFNAEGFKTLDYAIKAARDKNIRLIMPLVDNNPYYLGSKLTYTGWRGQTNSDAFFTNPTVINDYKAHITHVLNHVNPYTGLAYKNDPTILAWATGNELRTVSIGWDQAWTQSIADHIKSLAPNQLVIDGHDGIHAKSLTIPSVDLYTMHYYSRGPIQEVKDAASQVKKANKAFFVGEFDWTPPAAAVLAQDSTTKSAGAYSARVDVTRAASPWYVKLEQSNLSLTAGQTYSLAFWAKASAPRPIRVALQKASWPETTYFEESFNLTTTWQRYTATFAPSSSASDAVLSFRLAEATSQIWLDDAFLAGPSGANMLTNGSFEGRSRTWMSPWMFTVKDDSRASLAEFLSAIEDPATSIDGSTMWSLFGHDDDNGYVQHSDGYTLHYPGDTSEMRTRAQQLRTHAYKLRGQSPPTHSVPGVPRMGQIAGASGGVTVAWRGTAPADQYAVERSADGVTWSAVASTTDNATPWLDAAANPTRHYVYRVRGRNLDGIAGPYSNIEGNGMVNGSFDVSDSNGLAAWVLDVRDAAQATVTQDTADKVDGSASARVEVGVPSTFWHAQLKQFGVALNAGQRYRFVFSAKASTDRPIHVLLQQGVSPYTVYLDQVISVTTAWQEYALEYTATATDPTSYLSFSVAEAPGQIWFDRTMVVSPN